MHKHKKGYITIYVLLACTLCMVIVTYIFCLEIRKIRNAESYKKIVSVTKKYDEYKEYLFTYLHKEITTSTSSLNYASIKSYLCSASPKIKYDNDKACIKYDSTIDKIILETYNDSEHYRRDLYDYKVVSDKLIYVYLSTTYVEGRVR